MTATPSAGTGTVLVDAAWAQAHLDDPTVRFVEVDVDTTSYSQSHLPGAVGWDWTSQLADGIRRDIAGRDDFGALLARSGIGPDTTVVLYGDNNNWFAAWAYWQLKLYGHRDVRILDGGRRYWLDQGLPLTTDVPTHPSTGYNLPAPDFALRAFRDDILPRLDDPSLALVDVRSAPEFNGEVIAPPGMTETAQRAGHIPGAVSIPWAQAVREDGTFKSADELAALYGGKGITADRDVIAYCRIGERSSHTWFVLHELLGYQRVRNYDGSWTEWGSMVGVPIDKAPTTG
jgi:thiosulfate/3-mercaptopyruvate sulfurtransferase